ncbi:hypothetical protein D3C85_1374890 [compost metagenome]
MRHLPQAKDSQQDERTAVELVRDGAVANHRRRSAGERTNQRTVDGVTFHIQAVDAHIHHETHHPQPAGQRVSTKPQQHKASNTQQRGVHQRDGRGYQAFDKHPILGPFHLPVDIHVDVVVKYTTGRNHQRHSDKRGCKEGVINAALRGQQEPSDHGDQIAEDDAWFRYLQVLLKHTRRS